MKRYFPLLALTGTLLLVAMIFSIPGARAAPVDVAYDMVGSTNLNLLSHTNPWAGAFASAGDGFEKYQRGVSSSIPFAVLDDSLIIFPPDSLGIIKDGNTEEFFGAVDTENPQNSGPVSAVWEFDISGASDLSLSIDMGAMGDFESSDYFDWTYQIDGGITQTAFSSWVDEAGSQTYTMEGGAQITLNDPMYVNSEFSDTLLTNDLQSIATIINGTGSQLTLTLTLKLNGGSETVAFQDVVISSGVDFPPFVRSTEPTNNATDVPADTNIEVHFSEIMNVNSDWFEINCLQSGSVQATSDSGPQQDYTLDPVDDFVPGERCTVTIIADEVADQNGNNLSDDYVFSFQTGLPETFCGDPARLIHEVQGPGDTSPLVGNLVVVEGVVVGDFQEEDELQGFFVQEEKAEFDNQKETSEGIFVYEDSPSVDVEYGQRVRVTGMVDEFKTLTEINNVEQILICGVAGTGEYAAVNLRLPEKFNGELEQYEGMAVKVMSQMTVAQNYFVGRYGQLTLTSSNRLYQPTNQALPGSVQAETLADRNARNLLFLDDGVDVSPFGDNPDPVPYLGPPPPIVLRGGDTVQNLVGVLDFGQINTDFSTLAGRDYRLQPTEEPTFTNKNARPYSPDAVGGSLKVATMNVLNYFTTIDAGSNRNTCGPNRDQGCRGADSESEFIRQETKIVEALAGLDADIVGLVEMENHADADPANNNIDPVLGPLVDALNAKIGAAGTYDFIDAGVIGSDVIKVGFIYKPANVTPAGSFAILDSTVDPDFDDSRNRPVIAQTFEENATGELVTVAVNHLKSKGSGCGPGDDDTETGQGNCNLTRQKAAAAEVAWLAGDPTDSGDPDFLIIGDLNSYAMEDPITTITDAGYIDMVRKFAGPKAYSYTFDGLLGYLDHALASNSLNSQIRQATVWHINTDEPAVISYDENFNPPGYYSPDVFRASDHDPVIVGLMLK